MGNLFAELKRRHIYRVAAAYAVVAWVLIQLVNNITPMLNLPASVGTVVLVLLAVGFPVAVLFAWIHQLAPADGAAPSPKASKLDWTLIGALVVVIALVSYQQLAPATGARTAQEAGIARPAPTPGGISIAVLPFANLSGDATQEFFSDGMTEEINAALTKVPDLHVVARTSAFEFKGQNGNVRSVGQALGASHLIEGSVRKAGNRVRITAQLVRADNGLNLWSENYDRDLNDVFAIQEEIAQAIAASLRVPLGLQQGETLVRSRTKDEGVYEDYLRAKALVRTRNGGPALAQLTEAARLLESVIAREPDFAPAPALLAYAYSLIPTFNPAFVSGASEQIRPAVEALFPKAAAAAQRAIQLDPKNADGYLALAEIEHLRGRFSRANDLFTQGLMLDPSNPDGLHFHSGMLADLGYLKQAVLMRERLLALEPLVPIYRAVAGRILLASGQPDAALAALGETPSAGRAHIYAVQGRYSEAADAVLALPAATYLPGTREAAARLLRTAPAPVPSPKALPPLGFLGFAYLYAGAQERALDWNEANLKLGDIGGAIIAPLWGPSYASIRKTERFKTYLRNVGLVDYWRARGWPDLCRPMGADDFVCD